MKYIKQIPAALLVLTLCLSAAGCGNSGNTASNAPSAAQENAPQSAGDAQNSNVDRPSVVSLSGLPLISEKTSYQELLSTGWTPVQDYAEETLSRNSVLAGMSLKNDSCPGFSFNYSVVNCGEEEITVADSFLYDYSVQRAGSDSAAGTEIGLPCGLTMASSLDEVKAALGKEAEDVPNEYEPELAQYKFTYQAEGDYYILSIYFLQSDTSRVSWIKYGTM